ncbi:hypothetical protein U3A55_08400 [Salarchaeum sp. III]
MKFRVERGLVPLRGPLGSLDDVEKPVRFGDAGRDGLQVRQ